MAKELPLRSEINEEYKWKLEDIYPSDEEWEKDFDKVKEMLISIKDFQGNLVTSSTRLYEGLYYIMEIDEIVSRLYAYAHMRSDEDTTNSKYQGLENRALGIYSEYKSSTSFMIPEIISLSKEELSKYIEENNELKIYGHFLKNIMRKKEHYLSADEEKLLAMSGEIIQGPDNIFSMLNNADLVFPVIKNEEGEEVRLTHGRYIDFMISKDRSVRKNAFTSLYSKYKEFNNTFAAILSTNVKGHIFHARARKYNSSLEAALDVDNISVDIYVNLIDTVKENIDDMYRYISLRKKVLKLDEIHMYDIYAPLVDELDLRISYEEAKDIVTRGLAPLGEEYIEILNEGFNEGWIDVYENRGKRAGAYSSSCYGVHPYVLLNYVDNLDNVFTLAHEMGHAIHTYYSDKNQPYVYGDYKIFLAEVASTLNEILLSHYLLEKTDDVKMKRYLINNYLEQFRGTVIRQTKFAEFEKIIHDEAERGVPLTAEYLNEIYYQLNKDYYGEEMVIDDEIALEWSRIPHFYYNFYVYKYATGFSAASALASKIISEGDSAVEKYMNFLKSGDSDYPINILKAAGVDMSTPGSVNSAIALFREYITRFEELL